MANLVDLRIFIKLKIVIAMILIKDFINKIIYFDVSNNDTGGSIYQDDGFDLLYTKDNSDIIWKIKF